MEAKKDSFLDNGTQSKYVPSKIFPLEIFEGIVQGTLIQYLLDGVSKKQD
ncbi:MAG: hypothetical protein AB3K77_16200 [Methanosarcinaceae archaeon]|nr:hypothetical protein [Methanosarcina sp. MTP4]